jgi:excisionase family DNA binding protein
LTIYLNKYIVYIGVVFIKMNKDPVNIELLNAQDMMELFKVTRQTINNWMKQGLPHIKIGKTLRFDKQEVIAWVEDYRRNNITKI